MLVQVVVEPLFLTSDPEVSAETLVSKPVEMLRSSQVDFVIVVVLMVS